jgi:UDP-GlcNAc:undecaprenyl-phosphate/decaprenyl-phosphate GlcNAc-1-phosphate transferase
MKAIAYVLFASAIFVFSILVNDFLLKFLRTLGTQNMNGDLRWTPNKKPAIGGITFFICFLLATISIIYTLYDKEEFNFLQFYGIVGAIALGFIAGLFDDAYSTIPWLKLMLQILCGLILSLTGTMINIFDNDVFNHAFTVFWVVGMMNAINLLDNMDGISSVVTFFIILSCMLSAFVLETANDNYFLILLGTAVTLISFLRYNWWPSKMFMGDTGSMFLGVFIAAFGVIYFWNFQTTPENFAPISARFAAIAVIFSLPLIDTTTVFLKRLFIQRKSPFKGGKDHTTHHLSYLGLSDRQVALVFTGISIINTCLGVLLLLYVNVWNEFHVLAFGSWFVLLFGFLFVISNLNTTRNETK